MPTNIGIQPNGYMGIREDDGTISYVDPSTYKPVNPTATKTPSSSNGLSNVLGLGNLASKFMGGGSSAASAGDGGWVGFGSEAGNAFGAESGEAAAAGSGASAALPIAASAALGVGSLASLYNMFSKNRNGTRSGVAQGAASGAAFDASLGFADLGLGTAVGALAGSLSTKSRTREEQHKRDALIKAGINVPIDANALDGKSWENNAAFAKSRNEKDLTGGDIKNASDFYGEIPGYASMDDAHKAKTAQEALTRGLVKEDHGTIRVNMEDPSYKAWVTQMTQSQANKTAGGGAPSAPSQQSSPSNELASLESIRKNRFVNGPRYDYSQYFNRG